MNRRETGVAVASEAGDGDQPRLRGVVERITAQASAFPGAMAVERSSASLTYSELETRAGKLARHLQSIGVGPEVVVAVCFPRSIALVVAELAVLKAGGAYLPLDPGYPPDRLAFLLNDACVTVVLAQQCTANRLPWEGRQVIGLDAVGYGGFPDHDGATLPH